MAVRIERMTLHSSSYQGFFFFKFFKFFNWPDSCCNNVKSNKVKTLPPQLQTVNMSHSSFFQQDLSVFNVGPHNVMFYDVVRRQCDRSFVLCKGKNAYKNTRYVFNVPYQYWILNCFINIDAFELGFWYSEVQQLLVSIMIIFPSPWTYFTNKCREGNILSFKGYYNR